MTMPPLNLGDHLAVQRLCYSHHGLYVGDRQVIHYQGPFANDDRTGQIVLCSLDDFHSEQPLQVLSHQSRPFSPEDCVARAFSRLGEQDYHLLFNNCEHFVLWCIEGFHYSKQINQLISTGCIAHQALRTVTQKPPQAALSGMTSSTVPTPSATTAVTAAVGALLGTTATSLAGPLAATYGLYRAWRWFRD